MAMVPGTAAWATLLRAKQARAASRGRILRVIVGLQAGGRGELAGSVVEAPLAGHEGVRFEFAVIEELPGAGAADIDNLMLDGALAEWHLPLL